ncbi:Ig-like domain-containing protein [Pseudomonas citronellolis]|uniref:Ig-like domain-containing protein n=1 Tax=Pseudomonas citronellolis TaxID=53408 RepID=UPI00226F2AE3|nr:Ig-like domain-containing protein [Pseudomonas citronellolis]WAB90455.1 Ig-like domain-containing protein [Pseudomonas citronellolis]
MTDKNWNDDQDRPQASLPFAQDASAGQGAPAPRADKPQFLIEDDIGTLKGVVESGGYTNDKTPTFKGKDLTPGQEVFIRVVLESGEVQELGSAVVRKNGTWALDIDMPFQDGVVDFYITVDGVDSDPYRVTFDSQLPEPVELEEPLQVLAGERPLTMDGGQVQANAQPSFVGKFAGQASEADMYAVLLEIHYGTQLVTVTAEIGSDGTWRCDWPEGLAEQQGDYTLKFFMIDAAGNVHTEGGQYKPFQQLELTLDMTPPGDDAVVSFTLHDDFGPVTGVIAAGGKTDDTTPRLEGQVANAAANGVKWVEIRLDGNVLARVPVDEQGNWEYTPDALTSGAHHLEVFPLDAAENYGKSASIDFEVAGPDVPPLSLPVIEEIRDDQGSVSGLLNDGDVTDDTSLSLKGHAEAGNLVLLYVGGVLAASAVADENGNWTAELPLAGDGEHVIIAKAQDDFGRHSDETAPVSITLDTIAPEQPGMVDAQDNTGAITGPIEPGSVTDETQPTLSGSGEPGDTVSILDNGEVIGTVVVDENGQWEFTPEQPLEEGDHSISVVVTDPAGNASEPSESLDFSVDSSVPAMVIDHLELQDDFGPVVGAIANGSSTDDATPTVVGHVEGEAAWVEIYDGETLLGTALVDGDGNWSFQAPELESGEHSISARPVSAIGQEGETSDSIGFTLVGDETPLPQLPVIDEILDDQGTFTGLLNDGDLTDDASLSLKGSAEAGKLVLLYVNGKLAASVVADEQGNWTAELPLAGDGEQVITAKAQDDAGRHSDETAPVSITLDATAPDKPEQVGADDNEGVVQGPITQHGATNDNTPEFSGQAEPGSTVIISDNGMPLGSVVADAQGNWSYTPEPPLADGSHSITVQAQDAAGNLSEPSDALEFSVWSEAPQVSIDHALDDVEPGLENVASGGITNDLQPTLVGTATAGALVVLSEAGLVLGSAVADAEGNWSITLDRNQSEGPHTYTAEVRCATGEFAQADFVLVIDNNAPDRPILDAVLDNAGLVQGALASGDTTDDATPTLQGGEAEPNGLVKVYDNGTLVGSALADENGDWSLELPELADGAHSLTVTSSDAAGNESKPTRPFELTVDTAVADLVIDSIELVDDFGEVQGLIADGGKTDDTTPLLQGHVEGEAKYVEVYDGETLLGTAAVDAQGNWSFQAPELESGEHAFSAVPVDALGKTGEASESIRFEVVGPEVAQPEAPVIDEILDDLGSVSGLLNDGDVTDDTSLTVNGSADAGNLVLLYVNGELVASATADEQGNWTAELPLAGDGEQVITAKAQDEAGRHSDETTAVSVILDTTAPEQPGMVTAEDNTGAITGPIEPGSVTDETQPTLSGSGEPGDTVSVLDNGEVIGTVVIDENGQWEFTPEQPLEEGDHSISVVVTDPAGNASEPSESLDFSVDSSVAPMVIDHLELQDDFGPVVGSIANGSSTDDATPTVVGHVEGEAAWVEIYDGETLLGTALVDDEGNWSFQAPELESGEHSISARPVSAIGQVGEASDSIAFTLVGEETDLPQPPVIDEIRDDQGSITGLLNDGDVTDDTSLSVNGSAAAGNLVLLYVNGELAASVVADEQGNWSAELPLAGDGEQVITAKAQDAAGRHSEETAAVSVTLDTTAPEQPGMVTAEDSTGPVTGPIEPGSVTDETQPTLSGSGEPGDTVSILDNGEEIGTATVDESGNWTFTPEQPLEDGDHSISVVITDAAGNVGEPSEALDFVVDSTPVFVTIDMALDQVESITGEVANGGITNDRQPTLVGTATAGALVIISEAGLVLGSVVADAEGNWSLRLSVGQSDDEHHYIAEVQSATGATAQAEFSLLIDTDAPDRPILDTVLDNAGLIQGALASGDTTDDATPTLQGSEAEPNGLVKVYDNDVLVGSTLADENGDWSLELPELADGAHSLTVTSSDVAGNESKPTRPFELTVDTAAANLVIDSIELVDDFGPLTGLIADGDKTDDTTPLLQGHVEGEAKYVEVYDGETLLGTAAVDVQGNWSFQAPELESGEHAFSAVPVDALGKTGEASESIRFEVVGPEVAQPEAPVISEILDDLGSVSGLLNDGDVTDDTSLTVNGSAAAGDLVLLYVDGELAASVVADEQGNWTAELPLAGDGEHAITAKAQDEAGRHSDETAPVSVILDTTAPEQPGMVTAEDNTGAITGPIEPGSVTDETQPTLSGSGEPGDTVSVLDNGEVIGTVVIDENGQWEFTPEQPLEEGDHSLSVVVTDPAGNASEPSESLDFSVDSSVPAMVIDRIELIDDVDPVTGAIVNGDSTDDAAPLVQGHVEGEAAWVEIYDGETLLGTALVDGDGNWSFQAPELESGEHSISARPVNAIGQVGEASDSIGFTVVGEETPLPQLPVIDEIRDDLGSVTGLLNDGDVTDDTSLTVNGSADAGNLVLLYVNGELVASATADEQGNWSAELPLAGDGEHAITAKAQDPAGRHSDETAPVSITLDTIAPEQPGMVDAQDNTGAITGPIEPGSVTDETQPTLSGSGEPGDTVSILDNGEVIGTVVVDENGQWEFTPEQPLEEGDHSISVVVTDPAGNASEPSESLDFSVDSSVAPMVIDHLELLDDFGPVVGAIANGSSTDDATPLVQGHVEGEATYVEVYDGETLLGTAAVDGDGNWSFQAPELASGEHAISVRPVNAIGQIGEASDSIGFTVVGEETPLPQLPVIDEIRDDLGSVTGLLNDGDVTDDTSLSLKGTADAGNLVLLYVGGVLAASVVADEQGNWTAELPLAGDGEHAITAKAQDAAGRHSDETTPVSVILDTTAPEQPGMVTAEDNTGAITGPIEPGSVTDEIQPTLSGSGEPGDTVSILDNGEVIGTVVIDENGQWEFTPEQPLEEGDHSISVVVTDPAGNASEPSESLDFTVQAQVPTLSLDSVYDDVEGILGEIAQGGLTNDAQPMLSGTAGNGAVRVLIHDGQTLLGSALVDGDGNWQFELPELADGEYSLSLVAETASGTPSESLEWSFTVDTQAPEAVTALDLVDDEPLITGTIEQSGLTNDATPTFSGQAIGAKWVNIYDGSLLIASVSVDAEGNWSFTPEEALYEGVHRFSAAAVDEAGNEGERSVGWNFTVDVTAPGRVTNLGLYDMIGPNPETDWGDVPKGGKTDDPWPNFYGQVDTFGVKYVYVYDDGKFLGSATVNQTTLEWAFEPRLPLQSGKHSLQACAVDEAGNVGPLSEPWDFTIALPIAADPSIINVRDDVAGVYLQKEDFTEDVTLTVKGSSPLGTTVTLYANGVAVGSQTVDEDGYWYITTSDLSLLANPDGSVSLVAEAEGLAPTGPFTIFLEDSVLQPQVLAEPLGGEEALMAGLFAALELHQEPVAQAQPLSLQGLLQAPAGAQAPGVAATPPAAEAPVPDSMLVKQDLLALQQQQLV